MSKPKYIRKQLARFPIIFYKLGIDWMLGNRIAMITHIGRNSGRKRHTVLEVIRSDENKKEYVFYSGWGYNSDWVKNISKTPEIQLSIGGKTLAGKMDQLPISDTKTEVLKYAELHPFIFYLGT